MIFPKTRQVIGFPRAHRIGLLVDLNKVSINQIEKWIAFCMQKWGGRFYPFIPVNGSSLFARSEDLLRGCDPDYIISHEDISTDFKKKVQEISSPLKICAVRQDNL